jgi:FK506-binding protein 8
MENNNSNEECGDSCQEDYLDILGNGELLKKINQPGLGRESRPTHGDYVTIEMEGRLKSNNFIVEPKKTVSFILGDGDVIQALDMGVKLAEKHEEFILESDARFAYGEKGNPPLIPSSARLVYNIKLLQCDEAPNYGKMTPEERLAASNQKRLRGNDLYKREDFTLAVNSYAKAISVLEAGGNERTQLATKNPEHFEALLTVLNNLAAAQLKVEAFAAAIESSDFVLSYQPTNVKALYRKAKSHMGLGNYSTAIQLFREALEIEPESRITRQELQRCKILWQQEREQQSRMCKRMMGSTGANTEDKKPQTVNSWTAKLSKFILPVVGVLMVVLAGSIAVYLTNETPPPIAANNNTNNATFNDTNP